MGGGEELKMALTGEQLAKTTARVGLMRVGAFRVGFAPAFVTDGGLYGWRQEEKPTTTWTVTHPPDAETEPPTP